MRKNLEEAIKTNLKKSSNEKTSADEALKFTQAALNSANALSLLKNQGLLEEKEV